MNTTFTILTSVTCFTTCDQDNPISNYNMGITSKCSYEPRSFWPSKTVIYFVRLKNSKVYAVNY